MTSELRIETWSMPAADLGPENPLPPLRAAEELHLVGDLPGVPEEMRRNIALGRLSSVLPYTIQDGYTRDRHPRDFRVAVLENELLRATFLLERGGRLWSFVHKPSGRELLYVNPVLQLANLAIRNAWFSGGVEWNVGLIGHTPLTCSPLFAARVEGSDGTPVLRLYEWERIRQVAYQIDAYLPTGSPVLFVRIRIVNPHQREIPMYWWSNIAVPEEPDRRVLVPADSAYQFSFGELNVVPVPIAEGTDISYATHITRAIDFFFRLPEGQRPWIGALDGEGKGLVQTSTQRLQGRKLFYWGMDTGGRNWQEFLSAPGNRYMEIQAGLARTQLECLPMPAGAEWAWLEAYGPLEADPAAVHGSDWARAQQAVEEALERLIPWAALEAELVRGAEFADRAPAELLHRGSGWGALERLRREAAGELPFCSQGLRFDGDSLGEEQAPWVALLRDGTLPASEPDAAPRSFMVQAEWRALLEQAVRAGRGASWLAWLHLGVMRYYAGERYGALRAWEHSLAQARTPWALRNLAVLAWEEKRFDEAAEWYLAACRMRPTLLPLAVECGRLLIEAGRPRQWIEFLNELPRPIRIAPRIRLLAGQAAVQLEEWETVEALFRDPPRIDDVREGETSLSDLWFDFHERRLSAVEHVPRDEALRARVRREFPLPREFDYRLHAG